MTLSCAAETPRSILRASPGHKRGGVVASVGGVVLVARPRCVSGQTGRVDQERVQRSGVSGSGCNVEHPRLSCTTRVCRQPVDVQIELGNSENICGEYALTPLPLLLQGLRVDNTYPVDSSEVKLIASPKKRCNSRIARNAATAQRSRGGG